MAIDTYVQDMNHKVVEHVESPPRFSLSDIISDVPIGSLLDGIDPHYFTMFNSHQLKFLLVELAAVTPKNDQEEEMITNLEAAAKSAIQQCGYLFFTGD